MARLIDYGELFRLRDLGMSYAEIATRLNCSISSVEKAVRKNGLERRVKTTRVDVPSLFKWWTEGLHASEIGLRLGCSTSTVHYLRAKYALPERVRVCERENTDPTPEQIAERARECRERHYAQRRGESDEASRSRAWHQTRADVA